jgi:hypothetical protein
MRNVTKRKLQIAVPALVAATAGTFMGMSSAKGDFVVTSVAAQVSGGFTTYVVEAQITGSATVNNGSTLLAVDATVTTPGSGTTGALHFDNVATATSTANFNVDGKEAAGAAKKFGEAAGGTFIGVASGPLALPFVNNSTSPTNVATTQEIYDNGSFPATINPSGQTSSVEANLVAGTVHGFELVANLTAGHGTAATASAIPFMNIVVPTGTQNITVSGLIGGDSGGKDAFASFIINPSISGPSPTISLSTTAPSGSNLIGTVNLVGSNGKYIPQTVAVTGAAKTKGELVVNGFNPNNDQEIYGLDVSNSTSETLTQIAADLSAGQTPTGSGDTVTLVSSLPAGNLQNLLEANGDNLVATFGSGSNPAGTPNFFSYDLSSYTSGSVSISSITVVPEPTGLGALVLGGIGLLSRRKARKTA